MVSEARTFGRATWTSFPQPFRDKVAFVTMRDFELLSLHQNQMVSCFETLCVIIAGPVLGFVHTRANLLDLRTEANIVNIC